MSVLTSIEFALSLSTCSYVRPDVTRTWTVDNTASVVLIRRNTCCVLL